MDLWLWACALWPAASQASPPEMASEQWGHPCRQRCKPICLPACLRFPFGGERASAQHDRLRSHLGLSLFRVSHRVSTDSYSPHQFGRQIPLKDFFNRVPFQLPRDHLFGLSTASTFCTVCSQKIIKLLAPCKLPGVWIA